jgi:predicted AAA+ superfamily ATPase
MTRYVPRDLAPVILSALEEMPVVVVTGMRQTGKTTFLQNHPGLRERQYSTLDDFPQLEAARADPDRFVRTGDGLTIDEAQRCPEILTAIKKIVDKGRRPGQFLLSGSANFTLLKGMSESLAGRSVYFELRPFSRRELLRGTPKDSFLERFLRRQQIEKGERFQPIDLEAVLIGGMPSVCLREVSNRSLWFKGYEQTYLERDVRQISKIDNLIAFRHLLRLTALRTGQLLSPSQLARDAKLTAATTARYLSLFETSFITYRLNAYLRNRASRLIKSPKIYVGDSGLAGHLAGLEGTSPVAGESLIGALFETYVAQNLMSIVEARIPGGHLYFWGVQGRHEVDFVLEVGNKCLALEAKSAPRWADRDLSGLRAFLQATPHCLGAILAYNGTDAVTLGDRLWALPISQVIS